MHKIYYLFSIIIIALTPARSAFGQLAFTTDRDGNREVYVMNTDGSAQTNLTNNPAGNDSLPVWSPDRTKLAFASDRDGNAEVYVMNTDGSAQTNLTNNPAFDSEPAWSPDGTKLAFESARDGNREIYVMSADGSASTNLTNNGAFDADPAWSPDGTKLAFASDRNGDFEVYVMNADGSALTQLTNNPAFDGHPAWSPDGTKLAFESERDGNREIYVMNADGSAPTNLTNNGAFDGEPAWSPDGTKLAFASDRNGDFEVYVMNADGSAQTNLTNNPAFDSEPDWQPLVFAGLVHQPLGAAQLSLLDSGLLVSNIGSSGNDGVSLSTLGANVHAIYELPTTTPIDAFMKTTARGTVNGIPDQQLFTVVQEGVANGVQVTPDFSDIGAATYELELFNNGRQVFRRTGMTKAAFIRPSLGLKPCTHCTKDRQGCEYTAEGGRFLIPITVLGGPSVSASIAPREQTVLADFVVLRSENATEQVESLSAVDTQAKNIPEFTITDEWAIVFNVPHRTLGGARFADADEVLTITNIGSSGKDGVRFDFLDFIVGFNVVVSQFHASWLDLDPTGSLPVGAKLRISATGTVEATPDRDLGHVQAKKLGHVQAKKTGSALKFTVNFSPIGSNTHRVQIFAHETLVTDVTGHTGTAAKVRSVSSDKLIPWPVSFDTSTAVEGKSPVYTFAWPEQVRITIPGKGKFTGDVLRILSEGEETIAGFESVSLRATDIPSLSITDERLATFPKEVVNDDGERR